MKPKQSVLRPKIPVNNSLRKGTVTLDKKVSKALRKNLDDKNIAEADLNDEENDDFNDAVRKKNYIHLIKKIKKTKPKKLIIESLKFLKRKRKRT